MFCGLRGSELPYATICKLGIMINSEKDQHLIGELGLGVSQRP